MEEEDAYFDVERILTKRKSRGGGKWEYLIKWEGYAETTWEPEGNLATIPHILRDFEKNFKKAQKLRQEEQKKQREEPKRKLKALPQIKNSFQTKNRTQQVTSTTVLDKAERKRHTVHSSSNSPAQSPRHPANMLSEPKLPKKRQTKNPVEALPNKQVGGPPRVDEPQPKEDVSVPTQAIPQQGSPPKQNFSYTDLAKLSSSALTTSPVPLTQSDQRLLEERPNPAIEEEFQATVVEQPLANQDQPHAVELSQNKEVDKFAACLGQVLTDKPNLKTDKVAKIIGAKKRGGSIHYAVLFKVRRDGTMPTVGVYDHKTLKKYKFEDLSEYLLDSVRL